ncbi:putative DD34D transposase [Trichonephila clavipes]|nr:putative DD34D transposase [Trichonephila clavipes]
MRSGRNVSSAVWLQKAATLKETMLNCISDVKEAPHTGRRVVKIVDKITEINEDQHRGEANQTVTKPGLMSRKVILCSWWDRKGCNDCNDLLPYHQTLNSNNYCQQLDHLKLAIDQQRPELANRRGVVFHSGNAWPYTSVVTRQKLWELR